MVTGCNYNQYFLRSTVIILAEGHHKAGQRVLRQEKRLHLNRDIGLLQLGRNVCHSCVMIYVFMLSVVRCRPSYFQVNRNVNTELLLVRSLFSHLRLEILKDLEILKGIVKRVNNIWWLHTLCTLFNFDLFVSYFFLCCVVFLTKWRVIYNSSDIRPWTRAVETQIAVQDSWSAHAI